MRRTSVATRTTFSPTTGSVGRDSRVVGRAPAAAKVLEALAEALDVSRDALQVTSDSLAKIGDLSSASVLNVWPTLSPSRPPRRVPTA